MDANTVTIIIRTTYGIIGFVLCLWVFRDASNLILGLTTDERKFVSHWGGRGPISWVVACWIGWPLFFPWYLLKRSKYRRLQEARQQAGSPQKQRYRIDGVRGKKRKNVTYRCTASSEASARIMSEYEGIAITSITQE
jgi:hypothetical protein